MSSSADRIFITGMAASTCCGLGKAALFRRLKRGLSSAVASAQNSKGGGDQQSFRFPPITVDISDYVRITRTENELTRQLLAAVACDLHTKLGGISDLDRARMGIILGNTSGNYGPYYAFYLAALNEGHQRANPARFPTTMINYQASELSNALGIAGQSTTLSSGVSAGLDAIGHAAMRLRLGKERIILAGGIQEINAHDDGSNGALLGEAVAIFLLERLDGNDLSGERPPAEILGYASGTAGGSQQLRACTERVIGDALREARLGIEAIDAIFPSSNGTIDGESLEANALRQVFGARVESIGVFPVKSIVGECLAASGPVQCLAATYAVSEGEAALPLAQDEAHCRSRSPQVSSPRCTNALVLCVGMDGTCAALILGKT